MIGFLAAAVAVLAVVTGFNLLLCFAIIRRLRAAESAGRPAVDPDLPAIGTVVAPFSVEAMDGSTVTDVDFLDGESFVGLLQPGCPACMGFVARLERGAVSLPERTTILVASSGNADTAAYAARLNRYARTFVAEVDGPEMVAFGEPGVFPAFLRIVNGVITDAGLRPEPVVRSMRVDPAR